MASGRDRTSLSLDFFACKVERIKPTFQSWCDILVKSSIPWYLLSTYYVSGAIQGAGNTAVNKTEVPSPFTELVKKSKMEQGGSDLVLLGRAPPRR